MAKLQREIGRFTNDKTGEVIEYDRYYVLWQDIKLYLTPSDKTVKQLLKLALPVSEKK